MNYWKLFCGLVESRLNENRGTSRVIRNRKIIHDYLARPDSTALVSFPRTGSHWLRMMMECYFERPSLRRIFFFPDSTEYLCFHDHDKKLRFSHSRVIYLYRDPVDTLYSQMQFYGEPLSSSSRTRFWANEYAANLTKWLVEETVTEKKMILKYEQLREDPAGVFQKLCAWYGRTFDLKRMDQVALQVTRGRVDHGTSDRRVVNQSLEYKDRRSQFRAGHEEEIWGVMERAGLMSFFENENSSR